jgi:hypothetical protein
MGPADRDEPLPVLFFGRVSFGKGVHVVPILEEKQR